MIILWILGGLNLILAGLVIRIVRGELRRWTSSRILQWSRYVHHVHQLVTHIRHDRQQSDPLQHTIIHQTYFFTT
jgi:hypothetical protein